MKFYLAHFTKCCWNGRPDGFRYFNEIGKEWYKKDYVRYYNGQSTNKELQFAFFDFESVFNLNLTIKSRDIDVWVAEVDDMGNRKRLIVVGAYKIIEELLLK